MSIYCVHMEAHILQHGKRECQTQCKVSRTLSSSCQATTLYSRHTRMYSRVVSTAPELEFINILWRLKRSLCTHDCLFLIHEQPSCVFKVWVGCAYQLLILFPVERRLDPAFHWKQLLMRSGLCILLRMRYALHLWWKDFFSLSVHELHLKSWIFEKISFHPTFHFVYESEFWAQCGGSLQS